MFCFGVWIRVLHCRLWAFGDFLRQWVGWEHDGEHNRMAGWGRLYVEQVQIGAICYERTEQGNRTEREIGLAFGSSNLDPS